ncbi:uncharacterized protein [Musca autumnalis]|uniref:uncharacterized protein n=1 Tax=Musca autumnalis TaxID=221902 RepID=UPI003CF9A764
MTTKNKNLFKQSKVCCCSSGLCLNEKPRFLDSITGVLRDKDHEYALREAGLRVAIVHIENPQDEWQHAANFRSFFENIPLVCFLTKSYKETVQYLKKSKFIGYASIFVVVHHNTYLSTVARSMEQNPYLRYKSKIIICRYNMSNSKKVSGNLQLDVFTRQLEQELPQARYCEYNNPLDFGLKNKNGIDLSQAVGDLKFVSSLQLNHFIFVQCFTLDSMCEYFTYIHIIAMTLRLITDPVESTLKTLLAQTVSSVAYPTTLVDLYLYTINPALAIIINNYHFTNSLGVRKGSERDVVRLIRELKIARIPYILVEDASREELLKLINYISNKDFRPLKNLLIFLMSHGGQDDILHTNDGQVNIREDIVKPIQNNAFLQNIKIHFAINACRGKTDIEWADYRDLRNIKPTDGSYLHKNVTVLYSVPKNFRSLRSETTGSPFVNAFCQNIRHFPPNQDIRQLDQKINSDPNILEFFDELKKCTELILSCSDNKYNIIPMAENVLQVISLLKSIAEEFPLRESIVTNETASSFICGAISHHVEEYFAPQLDWDNFSLSEEGLNCIEGNVEDQQLPEDSV